MSDNKNNFAEPFNLVLDAINKLSRMKSEKRTERDRRIAIAITDLEKVAAWLYHTDVILKDET